MRALVLDGAGRVALAAVRALAKEGAHVEVAEQRRYARPVPAAFVTRAVRRSHVLPDLDEGFLDAVERLAGGFDAVLPVATNTVIRLARAGLAKTALPAADVLDRANRKDRVLALGAEAGVPVPRTERPRSMDEAAETARRFALPAVVKLTDDEGLFLPPGSRYRVVRTRDEFLAAYGFLHALKPWPLVQEYVEGDGYGYSALFNRGVPVAEFCHRRLREYPRTGGPSTACESVREPGLAALGRRLLATLAWHGVAMVEFKRERATGRWALMEVNPRLWGSLPLAVACGVNFPWLWARLSAGEALARPRSYPAGRRLRFLVHDLATLRLGGVLRDLFTPDGALAWSDPRGSLQYLRALVAGRT